MSLPVASLRCTLVNAAGFADELAEVKLTEEALILEGHALPDVVGIPWEELAHVLQHPFVQQRLDEVEMLKEARIV
jgi:hypothetical protein